MYEGHLLPPVFQNQIIHCDAGVRVVRAYPVEKAGAGYNATITNLLSAPAEDTWFRPSDVCVAPDGSLFISDWNDAGVGGHNMADQVLATMTGRILRVAPKGSRYSVRDLKLTTSKEAVAGLESPNNATRYLAWMKLAEMKGHGEKELVAVWKGLDVRARARALQFLARIQGRERKYIEEGLADRDSDIRITALRAARQHSPALISYIKRLVTDPSAQVRGECAIALRHNLSSDAPKLWTQLALQYDGQDRWYLEALGIGADKQADTFFEAWLSAVGDKWNTPAGRDIVWRARSPKAAAFLARIISDKATPDAERPRYFRAPAGLRNPFLAPVLHQLDLELVSWTRRGFDTVRSDPDALLARLARGLGAGDILLLHDGNAARTGDGRAVGLGVLPRLLERVAQAGLRPVTLPEMSSPLGSRIRSAAPVA